MNMPDLIRRFRNFLIKPQTLRSNFFRKKKVLDSFLRKFWNKFFEEKMIIENIFLCK